LVINSREATGKKIVVASQEHIHTCIEPHRVEVTLILLVIPRDRISLEGDLVFPCPQAVKKASGASEGVRCLEQVFLSHGCCPIVTRPPPITITSKLGLPLKADTGPRATSPPTRIAFFQAAHDELRSIPWSLYPRAPALVHCQRRVATHEGSGPSRRSPREGSGQSMTTIWMCNWPPSTSGSGRRRQRTWRTPCMWCSSAARIFARPGMRSRKAWRNAWSIRPWRTSDAALRHLAAGRPGGQYPRPRIASARAKHPLSSPQDPSMTACPSVHHHPIAATPAAPSDYAHACD